MNEQEKQLHKVFMEPDSALDSYLSTLLSNISFNTIAETQLDTVEQDEPEPQAIEQAEEKIADVFVSSENTQVQSLALMPSYAQDEFPALFFKVGHLILAVPLIELGRTIKFDSKLTNIPQQPIWFMGLKLDQDKKIGILNLAYLIQGKSRAEKRCYSDNPFKNIILTEDTNWGLACDEIITIKKITPDKVRWRTDRQRKPWLVGTIIEDLVVIVDVNELVPRRKLNN